MPPKKDKKSKGQGAQQKKSSVPKGPDFDPALFISRKYSDFKIAANDLQSLASPINVSITMLGKSIAAYAEKKYTFELRGDIIQAYAKYEKARLEWEGFRDSFRASKDADKVPTGLVAGLLGQAQNPVQPTAAKPPEGSTGGTPPERKDPKATKS
jgi:hypothetical protein